MITIHVSKSIFDHLLTTKKMIAPKLILFIAIAIFVSFKVIHVKGDDFYEITYKDGNETKDLRVAPVWNRDNEENIKKIASANPNHKFHTDSEILLLIKPYFYKYLQKIMFIIFFVYI